MLFAIIILLLPSASADNWKPKPGLVQRPVWPVGASVLSNGMQALDEKFDAEEGFVTNITEPTYTIYPPIKSNGSAIIVFPGGGYKVLAMDLEGSEVCEWLSGAGFTCVLLKYRVPYSGCYWDNKKKKHVTPDVPMALQDAQRTISTIRHKASELQIDPKKIGVMGFSAGGNLSVLSSTSFRTRSYPSIDQIDSISSRPDFAVAVFPGHLTMEHKNKTPARLADNELNSDIVISADIPPTLLVHAQDDRVDPVIYSKVYSRELAKAGVKHQLNIYKSGGHAFAVRKQGKDSDRWLADAMNWFKANGLL